MDPATLPTAGDEETLPKLRRLFARQVKRNLFDAYLRPNETTLKLVSNSISSSSCPGGEGMHFSASPKCHHILAYNSSRIYVIDVRQMEGISVKRELKILRRPASACVNDDATLLAVLATEMHVDLYDLESTPPKRKQSIVLDNCPKTITLSPCSFVLAAAYEGGIEVRSLNPGALPSDSRSVKCDGVDALAFSFDGTQLLGTTTQSSQPSTVILTAPYYDPGPNTAEDSVTAMWTTSILFPNSSRDCSHAVLLQDGHQEEAAWTFAYDRSFQTFRAVRIDDLRNGTTYFTGPEPETTSPTAKLLPSTLPGATYRGELVATGFHGKEVWLYGVPEDLEAVPETGSNPDGTSSPPGVSGRQSSERNSSASKHSGDRGKDLAGKTNPRWKLLSDRLRNTFVTGSKVTDLAGVSNVKWVADFNKESLPERLVITGTGVNGPRLVTDEEDMDFVDGGRIRLLDFDYRSEDGFKEEITIEVGANEAEVLEEAHRDMETEVAIVRRRTVAQRRGTRGSTAILRATTSAGAAIVPPLPNSEAVDDDPLLPRRVGRNPAAAPDMVGGDDEDESGDISIEAQEALDAPYAHANPRSQGTLRRAATAAAVNRTLNPCTADGRPIEYRRADGRREHPHESDADNWVPPPPPYQKEDPGDLPAFLRAPAISPAAAPPVVPANAPPVPPLPSNFDLEMMRPTGLAPLVTSIPAVRVPGWHSLPTSPSEPRSSLHQRTSSDSASLSPSRSRDTARPLSSPSFHMDEDELYDITPPGTPRFRASRGDGSPSQAENRAASHPSNLTMPRFAQFSISQHSLPIIHSSDTAPTPGPASVVGHSSPPNLAIHIPEPHPPPTSSSWETQTSLRRLSNFGSWPARLEEGPPLTQSISAFPSMAPSTSAFPPVPPPISDNGSYGYHQPNRYLSGAHTIAHMPLGNHGAEPAFYSPQPPFASAAPSRASTWDTEQDFPMIISTPQGVSGGFDAPRRNGSNRHLQTPIHMPVPRRPRPGQGGWRPTAQQFESQFENQNSLSRTATGRGRRFLSAWRSTPSVSPGGSRGVGRQPSRAERSAAQNMKDARRRSSVKKKGKNKNKNKNGGGGDGASNADWTDVATSPTSKDKDKKCVVM